MAFAIRFTNNLAIADVLETASVNLSGYKWQNEIQLSLVNQLVAKLQGQWYYLKISFTGKTNKNIICINS